MILPPCAPEVLDGLRLIREVRPYRTSRFQLWSGVKVNIGEQREIKLASCPDNCSRCCHLSANICRGNVILRTGSQSVLVHRTDGPHGIIQLYVDEIGMCRVPPNWSTVLRHRIAEGQC